MKSEMMTALARCEGYVPAIKDDYTAPVAVRPAAAARMLSLGLSKLYELIRDEELAAYTVGRARFIPVASIRDFISRRVAASGGGAA